MEKRINLQEILPQAYKPLFALETFLTSSAISKTHKELIKIRASQINGCAFCIDMHTKSALQNGETPQRIFLLNAWKEANLFTEEEKVILAVTEEITLIHRQGLSDETYQKAIAIFDENYLALNMMYAVTINAWNRIAVSTKLEIPN